MSFPTPPSFPSLSLDPAFNLRLFSAGDPAGLDAARRWLNAPDLPDHGALNLLAEGVAETDRALIASAGEALDLEVRTSGGRLWASGSRQALMEIAGRLAERGAELGGELRAAVRAFTGGSPKPTLLMGILNVTPDSFSDGGEWLAADAAVQRGLQMLEEGADILDIGGESTRPGAVEVSAEEELRRVLPVVQGLRARTGATLSIDTRKSVVAEACLQAGADWVNDVSGLTYDPELATVAARHSAVLLLMHSRSRPEEDRYSTEYDREGKPVYEDVVADTLRWLRRQIGIALERGVPAENLWIDPGFGFGKTPEQNVELLRRLREYTTAGLPVLIGTSRKSTIGHLLGGLPPHERVEGTAATVAWAVAHGAAAVRVHDVREMARIVRVTDPLVGRRGG